MSSTDSQNPNVLLSLINTQKPKGIQFTMKDNQEKQKVVSAEGLDPDSGLVLLVKWLINYLFQH